MTTPEQAREALEKLAQDWEAFRSGWFWRAALSDAAASGGVAPCPNAAGMGEHACEPFRCANCIATHPPAPAVQARVGLTEEQIIRLAGGDDGEPAASWQFDREELVRLYSIWFDAHGIPPCCRGLT